MSRKADVRIGYWEVLQLLEYQVCGAAGGEFEVRASGSAGGE